MPNRNLFGEGIFHGKAIYDLHAFRATLGDRFPAETLLSHDLIEGSYAGVGFASDIELFENLPTDYVSYCKREQRWIRGDWQIARWIFGRVSFRLRQLRAELALRDQPVADLRQLTPQPDADRFFAAAVVRLADLSRPGRLEPGCRRRCGDSPRSRHCLTGSRGIFRAPFRDGKAPAMSCCDR